MFLYEGMREYTYQKIAELIFQKESGKETWAAVPTYAVIGLGFEILLPGGLEAEAGMVVRRSHFRLGEYSNASAEPTYEKILETDQAGTQPARLVLDRSKRSSEPKQVERILAQELALRKYGFTSTALRFPSGKPNALMRFLVPESLLYESDKAPVDIVNIQVTRTMEVIDFGPYNFLSSFTRPLVLGKPQDENPYGGGRTGRTPDYWVAQIPVADSRFAQPVHLIDGMERNFGRNIMAFDENAAFLDNVSAVYFLMDQVDAIGLVKRNHYEALHCKYLKFVLRQVGREASEHSSTKDCPAHDDSESVIANLVRHFKGLFPSK